MFIYVIAHYEFASHFTFCVKSRQIDMARGKLFSHSSSRPLGLS